MTTFRSARPWLVALALTGGPGSGSAQPPEPLTGKQLAALALTRQERVTSARFELTVRVDQTREALVERVKSIQSMRDLDAFLKKEERPRDVEPLPTTGLKKSWKARVLVDGSNRARLDYASIQYNRTTREFWVNKEVTAFDGRYARTLRSDRTGEPLGSVQRAGRFRDAMLVTAWVPLNSIRGQTEGLRRGDIETVTPTGRRAPIDGVECVEYLAHKGASGSTIHLWLAPARDWQVYREVHVTAEHESRYEVRYQPDRQIGWALASWVYTETTAGRFQARYAFAVDSYELNGKLAVAEFVPAFPPGTKVYDEDTEDGVVGIILDDGRSQPVDGRPAYQLPGGNRVPQKD